MNPDCSLLVWTRNRETVKTATVSTYEWWEIGVQASGRRLRTQF